MPTKKFPTLAAIAWLKKLVLPEIDRLEMDHLLADLEQVQQRLGELEEVIAERCGGSEDAAILATIPGVAAFTATSLACRVGRVERFPRSHSLANYWGLTPGCRNSGEANQRLGRITKAGSSMARWLLAQVTHKVLRKDRRATRVVQTHQTQTRCHHRTRCRDEKAGHHHLAHADQTHFLSTVSAAGHPISTEGAPRESEQQSLRAEQ